MCITIVCFTYCDVINLGINLIVLIKTKSSKSQDKNLNTLSTKQAFKLKSFSVAKSCLRRKSAPLTHTLFVAYAKNCSFKCGLTTRQRKG